MKSIISGLTAGLALVLGSSLPTPAAEHEPKDNADAGKGRSVAQILMYSEQEKGIKPYPVRYIVTDAYLRNDDGIDNGDFTLLDRRKKIIYNVSRQNRTILVVSKQDATVRQEDRPRIRVTTDDKLNLPKIDSKSTLKLKLEAGKKVCNHYIVVPGLMRKAVAALTEFRSVLAGQHAANLHKTPKSLQDPCFTAFNIVNHSKHLEYGLVVRQWNSQGKQQLLVDYAKNRQVNNSLFVLPKGYKRYKVGEVP